MWFYNCSLVTVGRSPQQQQTKPKVIIYLERSSQTELSTEDVQGGQDAAIRLRSLTWQQQHNEEARQLERMLQQVRLSKLLFTVIFMNTCWACYHHFFRVSTRTVCSSNSLMKKEKNVNWCSRSLIEPQSVWLQCWIRWKALKSRSILEGTYPTLLLCTWRIICRLLIAQ